MGAVCLRSGDLRARLPRYSPTTLFPYVVMDRMMIWDAATHTSSLTVVFAGALMVPPFIIGYTAYAYRVFRGKASARPYD